MAQGLDETTAGVMLDTAVAQAKQSGSTTKPMIQHMKKHILRHMMRRMRKRLMRHMTRHMRKHTTKPGTRF